MKQSQLHLLVLVLCTTLLGGQPGASLVLGLFDRERGHQTVGVQIDSPRADHWIDEPERTQSLLAYILVDGVLAVLGTVDQYSHRPR